MKIDLKVKNLGRLKEAEFNIRPMTVITGQNETGKSFGLFPISWGDHYI